MRRTTRVDESKARNTPPAVTSNKLAAMIGIRAVELH